MAVAVASTSTSSVEINDKKPELLKYFGKYRDTTVHDQVREIADIIN